MTNFVNRQSITTKKISRHLESSKKNLKSKDKDTKNVSKFLLVRECECRVKMELDCIWLAQRQ